MPATYLEIWQHLQEPRQYQAEQLSFLWLTSFEDGKKKKKKK